MSDKKNKSNGSSNNGQVINLNGMYENYFLDYASYVILERAVPAIDDGLKPVQRRILHAMKVMDDGRFHKVANIIGSTMQYHPHGDAAIGDALVNLGQKELLLDMQGSWGDILTGDRAAAPRYIEGRLNKFALEVVFNKQTTEWQLSYDGRKQEPVSLPVKFPLLLALGVEGIAVGLSTKILPHNFNELIKASIKILEGKKVKIYPDFMTGGMVDVGDYNGGRRGGRIKVRSAIEKADKNRLIIREVPYGVTTNALKDSIIKANDKGKIKIKSITDLTAQEVEIQIELPAGESPDVAIDALYAFTYCENSISTNACVIIKDKPHFMSVEEILEISTLKTKDLLRQELEILKAELDDRWHLASLEKVFIEKKIYRNIEDAESFEEALTIIEKGLKQYIRTPEEERKKSDKRLLLKRAILEEDLIKLTEIKIRRISKYNSFKAEEYIADLEKQLEQVLYDLKHLTVYTIAYFERLLKKYGKGRERKTKITTFDTIQAAEVVASNAKLYANKKEGFVGTNLKKGEHVEFISDCSDIDDIIAFRADGQFLVRKVMEKDFLGKHILHTAVWKKGDDRTTYNMIYVDAASGKAMAKRFHVKAITRDREYDLTKGANGSKILYFSANPNGEAEVVNIQLTQGCRAKIKNFDFDFSELSIKGRGSQGNTVTKYPVKKISLKEEGKSTLGALEIWMDEVSGKLNTEERGLYLGAFDTGETVLAIYKNGAYEVAEIDLLRKFEAADIVFISKFDPKSIINIVYYDGERKCTLIKRFQIETTTLNQSFQFTGEHRSTRVLFATTVPGVRLKYDEKPRGGDKTSAEVALDEFIEVKGWRAIGNKLSDLKIGNITAEIPEDNTNKKHKVGDTVDLDIKSSQQKKLF